MGHVPGPVKGLFEPLDTCKIAAALNVAREGKDRGHHNLPQSDQQAFDDIEQKIVQEINDHWTTQRSQALGTIKALRENAERFNISARLAALRLSASNAIARFTGAKQDIRGDLVRSRWHKEAAAEELRFFKENNGLTRNAREPGRKWTTVGLLIFLTAIESVLNGSFFAKGSQFGLIGGIGIAIGISITNVMVSFLIGFFPARQANSRNLVRKAIGILATSAAICGIIFLHFFIAQYRDVVASSGEDGALKIALQKIRTEPWAFNDLSSFYLFGLGALFGFSAYWKGYHLDDPYPGYGPVSRRAHEAEVDYDDAYRDHFDELAQVRDETVKIFDVAITNMPHEAEVARSARDRALMHAQQLPAYEDHLEEVANSLLSRYREANREARSTPAPEHFEVRWKLQPRTDPYSLGISAEPAHVETVDAVLDEIRVLHDEVLNRYQELVTAVEHEPTSDGSPR
jgi:hypothetical protein